MDERTQTYINIFASRLNIAITKSGLSAADLCRKTGISESTIANYRAGRYAPKQKRIQILADVLGVTPGWLIGYDSEENLDEAIASLMTSLSQDQKSQVLDYIEFLASRDRD